MKKKRIKICIVSICSEKQIVEENKHHLAGSRKGQCTGGKGFFNLNGRKQMDFTISRAGGLTSANPTC